MYGVLISYKIYIFNILYCVLKYKYYRNLISLKFKTFIIYINLLCSVLKIYYRFLYINTPTHTQEYVSVIHFVCN